MHSEIKFDEHEFVVGGYMKYSFCSPRAKFKRSPIELVVDVVSPSLLSSVCLRRMASFCCSQTTTLRRKVIINLAGFVLHNKSA